MTVATLAPTGRRPRRSVQRDTRPLWTDPSPVVSAWRAPGFYLAGLIVLPVAAVVAPVRAVWRLF